uniref:RNA-directed RNA polymerase n=1 Tax=Saccharomyces uvarum virus L-A-10560 TaxID=2048543 RepID=A0A291R8P9_9VIRU|nr:gag-pol fusion protein [Saccharomyces uvarum virus L-A-10560]
MLRFVTKNSQDKSSDLFSICSDRGTFVAHNRVRTDFKFDNLVFNRVYGVSQKFTLVGNPTVCFNEGSSYLEGIAKKYLTLDGGLAIDNILNELKSTCGIPGNAVTSHAYNITSWRWYDNHVALLMNMLRAYHLQVLTEQGQYSAGEYPMYHDGHVKIKLDVTVSDDSAPNGFKWPGDRTSDSFPEWAQFSESFPSIDVPYIDVRPLTVTEVNFVLMMMSRWHRRTNLAIDYEAPVLADKFAYRHAITVQDADEWIEGDRTDDQFKPPSSKVMLSALRKYVNHNRLYNQFYTAAQLLSQIMMKPVPNCAEGYAWLMHDALVNIPKFGSIRGRYPFLLAGDAALIQATALEDWSAIMAKPELIFTYAMQVAVALNTGLYLRRVKKTGFGTTIDDSYEDGAFLQPETFVQAALACCTGQDAPLNGMSDVYVTYPDLLELDALTRVPVTVIEPAGYNIVDGALEVTGVPIACSPYTIFPVAAFDKANPYSGNFVIQPALKYLRKGALYDKLEAWKLAWAMRIAGYDTSFRVYGDVHGLTKFYADNSDSWTHIPEFVTDGDIMEVYVTAIERRARHFVELPRLNSPAFFKSVEVSTTIYDTYVQAGSFSVYHASRINLDYVKPVSAGIQVINAGELRNYWGSVRRTQQGFRSGRSYDASRNAYRRTYSWHCPRRADRTGGRSFSRVNIIEPSHGSKPDRFILTTPDTFPAWIRFRNRIQAVSRQKATHFLFDIVPATKLSGYTTSDMAQFSYKSHTYATNVTAIRFSDMYGLYVQAEANMTILSPAARRQASATYSQVAGFCYNTPTVMDTLVNILDVDRNIRPKHFKGLRQYERSKVTAQHHTHLRPDEVLKAAEQVSPRRKYYLLCVVELLATCEVTIEAAVATIMAFVLTLDEKFVTLFLDSRFIWSGPKGPDALTGRLKQASAQIKSVHTADYEPLTELFELAVLMNRGVGHVSWKTEREHREHPDVANVDQTKLYTCVRDMFEGSKETYDYPYMTWDDYTSSRWEWVPGGSVHSQYSEDDEYIFPGQFTRNKFITVNKMPKHKIARMIASTPEVRAWTSTKYEWGKQRAIYGTDLRSTLITNFAMFRCEDVLTHKFPVGDQAEASKVHKRVNMMLDGASSFCFDYDDFNSQHSIASMYTVLLAFRDAFHRNMSAQQKEAMDWVCESVKHMWVLDPDTKEWYQLRGTLLSGWRLTTFMNTVLNWAYMKIAGVFDIDDVQDSVHNGDDVMISLNRVSTAVRIMDAMHRINARAQPAKCNLFSISEFLRVEHGMSGGDGLGAQYLSRSCATLVHSRIESNEPLSVVRVMEADQTRLRDLANRTVMREAVTAISDRLKARVANIFSVDAEVVTQITRAHRVCGGISTDPWAPVDTKIQTDNEAYEIPYEIDDPSFWPGVNDYAYKVWQNFGERLEFNKIKDAVSKGSRNTIALKRKAKISAKKNPFIHKSEWERTMYKAYKGLAVSYYANLSKFMSIPPMANIEFGQARYAMQAALDSSDPLRALQIFL